MRRVFGGGVDGVGGVVCGDGGVGGVGGGIVAFRFGVLERG